MIRGHRDARAREKAPAAASRARLYWFKRTTLQKDVRVASPFIPVLFFPVAVQRARTRSAPAGGPTHGGSLASDAGSTTRLRQDRGFVPVTSNLPTVGAGRRVVHK